jgi:hypothetical protein
MSKSELACTLQGSAVGFVGVTRTSGSEKQHHCPIRAMVKDPNNAYLIVCVLPLFPQKCFIFLLEFIYSFHDFKEYMLLISSFKNNLQIFLNGV